VTVAADLEIGATLEAVVNALDRLAIPYFIVGSVASGARSVFRATNDIDLVCRINPALARDLAKELEPDFFVDLVDVEACVRNGSSFNFIHRRSILKVDFFSGIGSLEDAEFERASDLTLSIRPVRVASAEYVILAKLRWWMKSRGVLERQLEDVAAVIGVNRDTLDLDYLRRRAAELGDQVAAQLERLL
jgi:hypothetical protein